MDLHRFRTQNELFLYFSKKVTFYLNIYCNLKYNLMFSCNLSAPIPLTVYLLGSIMPWPCMNKKELKLVQISALQCNIIISIISVHQ